MTDGRAVWYPEDVRWMAWERTVVLGREFGPAAVSVLAALKAEAKVQNSGWRVKWGYHALDMAAFVGDVSTVRAVVARAAEIGLLDDFEEGEWTFVCRVSGMAASEQRARDAARKAAARTGRTEPDTTGHDRMHQDLQKRTEEVNDVVGSDDQASLGDAVEEPTTVVASGKQGAPRKRVDQDAWPENLPAALTATAELIHSRLAAIHDACGSEHPPSRRGAGLVALHFPDRDHEAALGDLEHWVTAGAGRRRTVKDWAATYRKFASGAPAKAGAALTAARGVPGAVPAVIEQWRDRGPEFEQRRAARQGPPTTEAA